MNLHPKNKKKETENHPTIWLGWKPLCIVLSVFLMISIVLGSIFFSMHAVIGASFESTEKNYSVNQDRNMFSFAGNDYAELDLNGPFYYDISRLTVLEAPIAQINFGGYWRTVLFGREYRLHAFRGDKDLLLLQDETKSGLMTSHAPHLYYRSDLLLEPPTESNVSSILILDSFLQKEDRSNIYSEISDPSEIEVWLDRYADIIQAQGTKRKYFREVVVNPEGESYFVFACFKDHPLIYSLGSVVL